MLSVDGDSDAAVDWRPEFELRNLPFWITSCHFYISTKQQADITTTTTDLQPFVWDYQGKLVQEETFTHSYPYWSSTILYQLPPFAMIHSILPVQFMCLTVFLHHLFPGHLWSTSWSGTLHFILHTLFHPDKHNYIRQVNGVNGGYTVMLDSVCHQSINRLWRHRLIAAPRW